MLSGVQERKMRIFRGCLTVGWLLLIVSLFWDPITPELTRPENISSPFHLQGKIVEVQGKVLAEEPYQMTNRIFWTMIIPVLPLFFLVAGHETWRRVCPLSFVSQIPRYLGWNRKRTVLIRRTGQIEKQIALVPRDSWWRKNVWYIQFGLLFLALNARILFVNSDRTALALFFIGVIIVALAVGYFWGGKTWCNYLCPIAIVQKIYTEPRGLLESQAHLTRQSVSQSMCRTSTPNGDVSICVGCTPNCPDIDLEKSYWEGIEDPSLRHVYYAFFGLIVGFYSFYYFYAGNWDYYFSGAWTHEADQIGNLFKPGMYIAGQVIGIPKILSAPLILGFFVVAAIILGKVLEYFYRFIVKSMQLPLTEAEIIGRCLSFSAYVSINYFYLFGGRPNLMLLPGAALRMVDIAVVALTTLWFWQAIQRNPTKYRREGLAASLLKQLQGLKVDISKYLEGRKLEELQPDEVYVLAKTLPSFSREQRVQAYRNILEEALRTGKADSSASLELLREVRLGFDISDDEHRQLVQELGIDGNDGILDPEKAASFENWIRVANYRRIIEPTLLAQLDSGDKLEALLSNPEVESCIRKYREIYQISEIEHADVISGITGSGGMMFERAKRHLEVLAEDAALCFGLHGKALEDPQWQQISRLLIINTQTRISAYCVRLFSILMTLGDTVEARSIAARIGELLGDRVEAALSQPVSSGTRIIWEESLESSLIGLLRGSGEQDSAAVLGNAVPGFREVVAQGADLSQCLVRLIKAGDPSVGALALTGITYLDLGLAKQVASDLDRGISQDYWLLNEIIDSLLGNPDEKALSPANQTFAVTLTNTNGTQKNFSFSKDYITFGRANDNDVLIIGESIAPYHMAICIDGNRVQVRKRDPFARIYVNGEQSTSDPAYIDSLAQLSFLPSSQPGPHAVVEWTPPNPAYSLEAHDTVTKLLWLSRANIFKNLELSSLAEIAASVEIRRYTEGSWICKTGDLPTDAFLLQAGTADVVSTRDGDEITIAQLQEGAILGELGVITGKPRAASIRITSPAARVLTINGERLRSLMERNAGVSMSMLSVVAGYVKS